MQEKVLNFMDMNVYYYVAGNPKNEAIVMLHPAFGDHSIFRKQFDDLKEHYYLVAIDMVSHGKSQVVKKNINIGNMPEIVVNVLELENVEKAHLLGVSLGSLVVQAIADKYPEKSKTVTVIGGYSIHKENKEVLKIQQKEMGKWIFYLIFSLEKFKENIVTKSSYTQDTREVFKQSVKSFRRKQLMGMNGTQNILRDKAEPVNYPLLIVAGDHDLEIVAEHGKKWAAIEPNARFIEVADAGHCANMENSTLFNQLYTAFLKDNS